MSEDPTWIMTDDTRERPADAPGGAGGAGEPGPLVAHLRALAQASADVMESETARGLTLAADTTMPYEARWKADRLRADEAVARATDTEAMLTEVLNGVLENAGEEWDGDDAAESIAIDYVRSLEADRTALADLRAGVKALADKYRGRGGFSTNFYSELAALLPGPESDARPAGAESEGETAGVRAAGDAGAGGGGTT